MSEQPQFTLTVDQNEYLPVGGQRVDAVVTVEAAGPAERAAPVADAAEVVVIDRSGSMGGDKIVEARQAARAAVETLRDGARFAVVAGNESVRMVYPRNQELAEARPATRQEAVAEITGVTAGGGTSVGRWLHLAADLLTTRPQAVRHAILLTDGLNNESDAAFEQALAYCREKFTCDSLGVGSDWSPEQLRRVSNALLGTFDFVREPGDLRAYFQSLAEQAMGKAVAEVSLRVWVPQGATVKLVKQVFPTELDLTGKRADVDARTGDYPTGSWGAEARDYQLAVEVPAGALGEEIRAAWTRLVVPDTGEVLARGNVLAHWTDDLALTTRRSAKVEGYTGQLEQNQLVQEGLKAYSQGDHDTATTRFAHARKLAQASGREHLVHQIDSFIEVDPETGTAQLRQGVTRADAIALDTGTDRTARMRGGPGTGTDRTAGMRGPGGEPGGAGGPDAPPPGRREERS